MLDEADTVLDLALRYAHGTARRPPDDFPVTAERQPRWTDRDRPRQHVVGAHERTGIVAQDLARPAADVAKWRHDAPAPIVASLGQEGLDEGPAPEAAGGDPLRRS